MRKFINQQDMKQGNALDVFALVRSCGELTRKEIEGLTALSWGAVSNIISGLLRDRYLTEKKSADSTGAGRTPSVLSVNGDEHFILGLDINASGFEGTVINLKNETVASLRADVPQNASAKTLTAAALDLARAVYSLAEGRHVLAAGVAMQGRVDHDAGISAALPFCSDWHDVPLAALIEESLGIPAFIEHDPDCLLYAWTEKEEPVDTILIRADNGIGMSVLLDGRIMSRPGMFEIGHMTAVPGGLPCGCGRRGCLECYSSAAGMARRWGGPYGELVNKAEAGDPGALSLIDEAAEYLAAAVVRASRFLSVNHIVLCGSLWRNGDLMTERMRAQTVRLAGAEPVSLTVMERENAAYGAALIALERYLGQK